MPRVHRTRLRAHADRSHRADRATPTAHVTASVEDAGLRAQVLLQRAVTHYQDIKDPALADFTGKGEFVDGELYVCVVSTAGVLLASGGPSSRVYPLGEAGEALRHLIEDRPFGKVVLAG